jgi:hypothetical protein
MLVNDEYSPLRINLKEMALELEANVVVHRYIEMYL